MGDLGCVLPRISLNLRQVCTRLWSVVASILYKSMVDWWAPRLFTCNHTSKQLHAIRLYSHLTIARRCVLCHVFLGATVNLLELAVCCVTNTPKILKYQIGAVPNVFDEARFIVQKRHMTATCVWGIVFLSVTCKTPVHRCHKFMKILGSTLRKSAVWMRSTSMSGKKR